MNKEFSKEAWEIMNKRFGKDSLIALATESGGKPFVRAVNAYYESGSFYVITHEMSNKMLHIKENSCVAICGDWFTAHGYGKNMGYILSKENIRLTEKLRGVFKEWYSNGHINENDTHTCILKIKLTDGVLFSQGTRYDIDFTIA